MTKAKNKTSKRPTSIPNKIIYSRVSYLYQAAVYLATVSTPHYAKNNEEEEEEEQKEKNRNNCYSKVDAGLENKTTTTERDRDVNLDAAPASVIASNFAVVDVVASNHGKQVDTLAEPLRNEGRRLDDKKEEKIISKHQDLLTNGTHNLNSSFRLTTTTLNSSRRLASELRAVSLKTQIRLSPHVKHSICKTCSTILIDGSTCSNLIENNSKGGKKPWADILVKRCYTCDSVKRFPISAQRQERREVRKRKELLYGETSHGNRT
ncbi:hypothetical protein EPUL_004530 [Erysiphe pulchra]|uniref:Rpr2-domain-containing protein n=1 Tax=Erysiphe pulchra TaxID=225359 RepID=A0A2S4PRU0_9PEZI|nr:hypothetical protein EPUL_004530 [Erysiphe pulchra]